MTGCQNNCLKAEENDVGIKGAAQISWKEDTCIHCGVCEKACREEAISFQDDKLIIDNEKCNYCGRCAKSCPVVQNVPRSIKEEGHQILKLEDNGDDTFTLIVKKVEDE